MKIKAFDDVKYFLSDLGGLEIKKAGTVILKLECGSSAINDMQVRTLLAELAKKLNS